MLSLARDRMFATNVVFLRLNFMKRQIVSVFAVLSLFSAGVSVIVAPQAAMACGEVAALPSKGKVVLISATHPSVRCNWQWGDDLTVVSQSSDTPLDEASASVAKKLKEVQVLPGDHYITHGKTWVEWYDGEVFNYLGIPDSTTGNWKPEN